MGNFINVIILTWKNFKLQLRHPWITVIELLIPVFFMLTLIILRLVSPAEVKTIETVFEAFDVDILPAEEFNVSENIYLYYTPQSKFLDKVMEEVSDSLKVKSIGFANEEELVDSYKTTSLKVIAGVIFDAEIKNGMKNLGTIGFTIRPESIRGVSWNLSQVMASSPNSWVSDKSADGTYYMKHGFLSVQNAVSTALLKNGISILEKDFDDLIFIRMCRQPYPPYSYDSFFKSHEYYIIIAISIGFFLPTVLAAKNIVHEGQTKLKPALKMMGVSSMGIWAAWFIKDFIFLGICSLIMTIMLCTRFGGNAIFNLSDASMIFLLLIMQASALITFTFFITTFFYKANSAIAATCICYIITFLPYIRSQGFFYQVPLIPRIILCVLPNTIFSSSLGIVIRLENFSKGLQWETIHQSSSVGLDFSMHMIFLILFIDILIYLILTWYVEVMRVGKHQKKYPWYFPLTASYWTGRKDIPPLLSSKYHFIQPQFEKNPSKVKPMIDVRNLTKIYDKNAPPVIDRIDLKAYKGQITVLLGYHCSGKSTFSCMINGSLLPTSGSIILKGYNMHKTGAKGEITPLLGICPDYDVSVDDLSVGENMYFFCRIKGFDMKGMHSEINHISNILDLDIEKNKLVSTLSTNSKRRLSIAIALIGESEIVILDEPTATMDSPSQRIVWDALLSEKKYRAIFLTSSQVKEANSLGDKIAVIDNGKLKCCGSPLFLKKTYGAGYHLNIWKQPDCNSVVILNLISSKIPNVEVVSNTENELKIILPPDCSHLYEALFKELEERDLKIKDFTVTETSLEDLYKRIVTKNLDSSDDFKDPQPSKRVKKSFRSLTRKRNEGFDLFYQHVTAVLEKRLIFSIRNTILTASQLFMLPLAVILAFLLTNSNFTNEISAGNSVTFGMGKFENTLVSYGIDPSSNLAIKLGDTYATLLDNSSKLYLVDLEEENYLTYLVKQAIADFTKYKTQYIIGAVFTSDFNRTLITGYYNSDAYHAAPISLLYIHNAILSYYTEGQTYSFVIKNKPLPFKDEDQRLFASDFGLEFPFHWSENFMIGMAIFMSSFVILLVIEKSSNFKMQQRISGLDAFVYWFSTFIYDYCVYFIPCILVIIILCICEVPCLSEATELGPLMLLFLLHGLSALLFTYCYAFCLKSASTAYIGIFLYYILGLCLLYVVHLLETKRKFHISEPLNTLFSFLMPAYCIGRGIYNIFRNCVGQYICHNDLTATMCLYKNATSFLAATCCSDTCGNTCILWNSSHFSLSITGIGKQLIALGIQPFFLIMMLIVLEMEFCRKLKPFFLLRKSHYFYERAFDIDKTVHEEAENMLTSPVPKLLDHNYLLVLKNVSKFYSWFEIKELTFGVQRGECFGLIGVDAAGKSTVLKMICGYSQLSAGNIYIDGFNISKYPHKVQDKIGFSSDDYTLLKALTIGETLTLYAHIRGIPKTDIKPLINTLSDILCLNCHTLVKNCNYSVKRKLNVAIAIIGNPPLILLDEPTRNMNPVACMHVHEALRQSLAVGCTILYTSQSATECESLSNRAAIIVKGKLTFIGELYLLSRQYKDGFSLVMRISKTKQTGRTRADVTLTGNIEEIKGVIEDAVPEAKLKMEYNFYLNYYTPYGFMKLSSLFGLLENMKVKDLIYNYSISEINLDQIFSYHVFFSEDMKDKKIAEYLKERQLAKF